MLTHISFVFGLFVALFSGCGDVINNYYGDDGGGGGDAFAGDTFKSSDTFEAIDTVVTDTVVADTRIVEDTVVTEYDTLVSEDTKVVGDTFVAQDTSTVADTVVNCDDGDPCTEDAFVNGSCVNEIIVCEDGDFCTTGACVDGECEFTPVVCNDGDHRTVEWCSPFDGQCHFQEWRVEFWLFVPYNMISGTKVHIYPHGEEVVLTDEEPFLIGLTYSQVCQGNTEVGIETQDLGWWGCDYDAPSKSEVTVWIGGEELDSNLQFIKHDWTCDWREDHGEGNLVFTPADFGCPTPE